MTLSTNFILFLHFSIMTFHFRVFCCMANCPHSYHRVCNNSNMRGVTSGTGTAYPSRAPEVIWFLVGFVLLDL